MGMSGIGIWQLLIVLVIVFMLFGSKHLRGLGGDIGSSIKDFKAVISGGNAEDFDNKTATLEQDHQDNKQSHSL